MRKKILILGVTGQDGSLLADYLVNRKFLVYGFIRKSSNRNYQNETGHDQNSNVPLAKNKDVAPAPRRPGALQRAGRYQQLPRGLLVFVRNTKDG